MTKKYEREIAELLEKLDEFVPEESRFERAGKRLMRLIGDIRCRVPVVRVTWRFSPTSLLVGSVVTALAGLLSRGVFPTVSPLLSLASLALFLAVFVTHIAGNRRQKTEYRWRGRVIELHQYRRRRGLDLGYRWHVLRTKLRRWFNWRSK